jgi:hypothetical protein
LLSVAVEDSALLRLEVVGAGVAGTDEDWDCNRRHDWMTVRLTGRGGKRGKTDAWIALLQWRGGGVVVVEQQTRVEDSGGERETDSRGEMVKEGGKVTVIQ